MRGASVERICSKQLFCLNYYEIVFGNFSFLLYICFHWPSCKLKLLTHIRTSHPLARSFEEKPEALACQSPLGPSHLAHVASHKTATSAPIPARTMLAVVDFSLAITAGVAFLANTVVSVASIYTTATIMTHLFLGNTYSIKKRKTSCSFTTYPLHPPFPLKQQTSTPGTGKNSWKSLHTQYEDVNATCTYSRTLESSSTSHSPNLFPIKFSHILGPLFCYTVLKSGQTTLYEKYCIK